MSACLSACLPACSSICLSVADVDTDSMSQRGFTSQQRHFMLVLKSVELKNPQVRVPGETLFLWLRLFPHMFYLDLQTYNPLTVSMPMCEPLHPTGTHTMTNFDVSCFALCCCSSRNVQSYSYADQFWSQLLTL